MGLRIMKKRVLGIKQQTKEPIKVNTEIDEEEYTILCHMSCLSSVLTLISEKFKQILNKMKKYNIFTLVL